MLSQVILILLTRHLVYHYYNLIFSGYFLSGPAGTKMQTKLMASW